jgi:hypothetical protein
MRRAFSFCFAVVIAACAPVDEPDGGEGEGEGEGACDAGSFHVSTTTFESFGCLDRASAPGGGEADFRFVSGAAIDLRVSASDEVTPPITLDESNSSAFGNFSLNGGARWSIATGAIGGSPVGEASLVVDAIDGTDVDGRFDGLAIPDADNPDIDGVFVTLTF